MKKIIIFMLLGGFVLSTCGCGKKEEVMVSMDELNRVNDKIIEYFQTNGVIEYDNYSYNYVDVEKMVVVVGLVDNSEKEQEWFRENVVNSKYIRFEQGEHVRVSSANINEKIDKIVNNYGSSSNPYDYIKVGQKEYDELLSYPEETFEYAIRDLFAGDTSKGLKGYVEALLCTEINKSFQYAFVSGDDFVEKYKEYLMSNSEGFSEYDLYAKTLLDR